MGEFREEETYNLKGHAAESGQDLVAYPCSGLGVGEKGCEQTGSNCAYRISNDTEKEVIVDCITATCQYKNSC